LKYYAVKVGKAPGIYENWQECREQINHYSGAVFKSFEDRAAAEAFLLSDDKPAINEALPLAYIDGSYSKNNSLYSWGGYIYAGGKYHILQGTGNNPEYLPDRNIAGEAIGALQVLHTAQRLDIAEINLYYDYAGLEQWPLDKWRATTALSKYYKDYAQLMSSFIKVNYIKVAGHSGIYGNEIADLLAKEAAGAHLRKKDIAALETFRIEAAAMAY